MKIRELSRIPGVCFGNRPRSDEHGERRRKSPRTMIVPRLVPANIRPHEAPVIVRHPPGHVILRGLSPSPGGLLDEPQEALGRGSVGPAAPKNARVAHHESQIAEHGAIKRSYQLPPLRQVGWRSPPPPPRLLALQARRRRLRVSNRSLPNVPVSSAYLWHIPKGFLNRAAHKLRNNVMG